MFPNKILLFRLLTNYDKSYEDESFSMADPDDNFSF